MNATKTIQAVVRATLKERFPKIEIVSINIRERTDDEGDEIIEIKVIFDAEEKNFDPAMLPGLPRLIMPKLAKVKKHGFPLFSFIAKSDLGKLSPEAA